MAYDGLIISNTVKELREAFLMGSITKIAQPEPEELLVTIKNNRKNMRLYISANASLPVVYITEEERQAPPTAPNFCMALRKHIGGGRITDIRQPDTEDFSGRGLERVICFDIEHLNEMGDRGTVRLFVELMGKHSNIILVKEDGIIIDSIKHITPSVSSVREVLPGREYFIPNSGDKKNPLSFDDEESFRECLLRKNLKVGKALSASFTGISNITATEICFRAGVDEEKDVAGLKPDELKALFDSFSRIMEEVKRGEFFSNIVYNEKDEPEEFSAIKLSCLESDSYHVKSFDSISKLLSCFYSERALRGRVRQKSEDIRHILKVLTERTAKKLELQERQLQDSEKKEKFRVWGELINTYGYGLKGGEKELRCENYYDEGREISIPLDEHKSAKENAKRYFDKYQKLKRTEEALIPQIEESRQRLWHLDSISAALSIAETEADLNQLRREMKDYGLIHKSGEERSGRGGSKRKGEKKPRREEMRSEPMHFVSSDGIDIYVGRNNYQNEEISFKLAEGNDWWFHAKNTAGSHVIAKTGNRELPDDTCLEAAALAAYYSKACGDEKKNTSQKIEVDYVKRKELKRVPHAAPGYVIYHTNYSIVVEPRKEIGYNEK